MYDCLIHLGNHHHVSDVVPIVVGINLRMLINEGNLYHSIIFLSCHDLYVNAHMCCYHRLFWRFQGFSIRLYVLSFWALSVTACLQSNHLFHFFICLSHAHNDDGGGDDVCSLVSFDPSDIWLFVLLGYLVLILCILAAPIYIYFVVGK
jgi:hypothetical protein